MYETENSNDISAPFESGNPDNRNSVCEEVERMSQLTISPFNCLNCPTKSDIGSIGLKNEPKEFIENSDNKHDEEQLEGACGGVDHQRVSSPEYQAIDGNFMEYLFSGAASRQMKEFLRKELNDHFKSSEEKFKKLVADEFLPSFLDTLSAMDGASHEIRIQRECRTSDHMCVLHKNLNSERARLQEMYLKFIDSIYGKYSDADEYTKRIDKSIKLFSQAFLAKSKLLTLQNMYSQQSLFQTFNAGTKLENQVLNFKHISENMVSGFDTALTMWLDTLKNILNKGNLGTIKMSLTDNLDHTLRWYTDNFIPFVNADVQDALFLHIRWIYHLTNQSFKAMESVIKEFESHNMVDYISSVVKESCLWHYELFHGYLFQLCNVFNLENPGAIENNFDKMFYNLDHIIAGVLPGSGCTPDFEHLYHSPRPTNPVWAAGCAAAASANISFTSDHDADPRFLKNQSPLLATFELSGTLDAENPLVYEPCLEYSDFLPDSSPSTSEKTITFKDDWFD